MLKRISKKAQLNQVFVYLLSIILIVFAGFLVIKFISAFSDTTKSSIDSKFYNSFEKDYSRVYSSYGSEENFKYSFSQDIVAICFIDNENINLDSDLNTGIENLIIPKSILSNGENIVIFDKNGILSTKKIGVLNILNTNFLCLKPKKNKLSIFLENRKNNVFVTT